MPKTFDMSQIRSRMKELRKGGSTAKEIAEKLNGEGFTTSTDKKITAAWVADKNRTTTRSTPRTARKVARKTKRTNPTRSYKRTTKRAPARDNRISLINDINSTSWSNENKLHLISLVSQSA